MWIAGLVVALATTAPGPDPTDTERISTYRHVQEVPEARIWLDRGPEPVLRRGDRVRISYRSSIDAYVAILQVDTDGTTRLLHPRSPTENHYVRAGRDYQLLFPRSPYWHVDDRPGVGYLFVVTSPEPFDFSAFRYSYSDGGWDLSTVGARVQSDPYVAMDEYVAHLIPDWEYAEYALDFLSYDVGGGHEYPRFMCYDCHGFQPYGAWNPYRYTCTNFRVIVYDDPYYYPAQRYRGDRVVFVTTGLPARPRYAFKARAQGEAGTLIVMPRAPRERDGGTRAKRRASPTRSDPGGRVAVPSSGVTRRRTVTSTPHVPATGARAAVRRRATPPAPGSTGTRPSLRRRPSSTARPSDRAGTRVRGSTRGATTRAVPSRAVKKPPARPATKARPKRSGGGSSSARSGSTRSGPAARALPKRSGGSSSARSGNTRSRPAVRKPPKRSGGGSSAWASSQARKPGAKASKARPRRGGSARPTEFRRDR